MKNKLMIIAIAIASCIFAAPTMAQQINPEISTALKIKGKKTKKVIVKVNIVFGKNPPACDPIPGICRGQLIVKGSESTANSGIIAYQKNKLALVIAKNEFSKEDLNQNFINGSFTLDDEFVFDEEIKNALKAKGAAVDNLSIKKGIHKVIETPKYFIIHL